MAKALEKMAEDIKAEFEKLKDEVQREEGEEEKNKRSSHRKQRSFLEHFLPMERTSPSETRISKKAGKEMGIPQENDRRRKNENRQRRSC